MFGLDQVTTAAARQVKKIVHGGMDTRKTLLIGCSVQKRLPVAPTPLIVAATGAAQ